MRLRNVVFVLLALSTFPAAGRAGPIEFMLLPSNIISPVQVSPVEKMLAPITGAGSPHAFDPATGEPISLDVVGYRPQMLPTPAARDLHADGTTRWNMNGDFGISLLLIDVASGEQANIELDGRVHATNLYSTAGGWTGNANFWFQDYDRVRLGGQLYTIWGTNAYSGGPAAVNVWVGDGTPPLPQFTPEPGTFALAALGLVPLGGRFVRRRVKIGEVTLTPA